jgi:predicted transposase/invertase (TIGR01784 family)
MAVDNPHDKYFKRGFSNIENVKDLFKNMLPEEISSKIDYNSLKLSDKSFVEEVFKEKHSDLLIEAKYNGDEVFFYLLIEHKSFKTKMSILQLLKYMVLVWERENKTNLTPIIPILLYHDKEEWDFGKSFLIYFDSINEILKKFTPNFQTIIIDLNKKSNEEIKGSLQYIIIMRVMKYIYDRVEKLINEFSEVLKGVDMKSIYFQDLINFTIFYIYETQNEMEKDEIIDMINDKSLKEVFMNIKERLIKDGEEKGRKEGKKEEQKQIAKKMKMDKIDIEIIKKYTGLTKEEIQKL